jgi:predicted flap endonuclease-1-like 5' DNA nuclease
MAYLIDQLVWCLLLAAAFAALAGWAYGATKAEAETKKLKLEREKLLRDLVGLSGEAPEGAQPADLHMELMRQRTDVSESKTRELEQTIAILRGRADGAEARIHDLERDLAAAQAQANEHLQSALDAAQAQQVAAPVSDDAATLQAFRLRYFEKRTEYLERQPMVPALPAPAAEPVAAPVPEHDPIPLLHAEWRARFAEAAADELLTIAREPKTIAAPATSGPSAEEIEDQQRRYWRALYMERRVVHLQGALDEALKPAAPDSSSVEDEARQGWRKDYLERRVAYLRNHAAAQQTQPVQALAAPVAEEVEDAAASVVPALPETATEPAPQIEDPIPAPAPLARLEMSDRPPSLGAARNGAPDDFTLIENISPMLQSTLYSLGFYHFDQIAAWTSGNIAWVDQYLRLRGRITEEEWVDQAHDLAQGHGVARAERIAEEA